MSTTENTNKISTPGERLKYIRTLSQLTREAIKDKFKISSATLRSWEEGKVEISDKKIKLCLKAYESIGILTDIEWVKTGKGNLAIKQHDKQNFIEKLLLSEDDDDGLNTNEEIDKEFLKLQNLHSINFISYIDKEEKFTFINTKYTELFQKPAKEIIGKTLEEMIGEQGYQNIKPYVARTFLGEEVTFEYPWKYGENKYRYLHLNFIPHKIKDKIVGFFSFIEDKEPPLPYMNDVLEKHNNQLFIDSFILLSKYLFEEKIKFTPIILTKLSYDLYKTSLKENNIDLDYAKNLINQLK